MPDGKITFSTDLDNKELEKSLAKIQRKIEDLENDISGKKASRNEFAKQSEELSVQLDIAKAKLYEMQTAAKGVFSTDQISEQKEMVDSLQYRWDSAQRQVEKYDRQIQNATIKLNQNKSEATEITDQLSKSEKNQNRFNEAIGDANKRFAKLQTRISRLASRVFIFSMITAGFRSLRAWMGDVIKTNDEASAALARLKGALLTMAQPLVDVIIPAFTTFVNILTRVITLLAGIVSRVFGKTAKQSAEAAKSLYDQKKAIDSVGGAAKSASKSLASFDEINTMQNSEETSGGTASGASAPDFSSMVIENIAGIEAIVGGALLAIGAILTFSGVNIPLGIGMMAMGALAIYDAVNLDWEAVKKQLTGSIGAVVAIVSAALLAIGAILTFSGAKIPLGIALMAAGALGLASVATINWGKIQNAMKGPVGAITSVVSAALLALGAILAFSGANIPLGIGLIVAGAAGLAAAIAPNWDTIVSSLQGPIGTVVAIVSAALLAIGAVLLFTGAGIPLGLGLIAAGAIGLAASIVPNWNKIVTSLQGPIGAITGIVGAALLVIGIILLFTGAGIPLGLGLIAVGAAGLAAAIAPNWDSILQKLKETWGNIKNWWNTYVAKYFTAGWWSEKGKEMINGLISKIESGINNLLSGVGRFVNRITGILSRLPGVSIPTVNWGNIRIPRLAEGAVIPPNREFMAVLGDQKHGTNIEAPLSTIQEAVAIVMEDMVQSNIAGHEATVAVLQAILEAVNAIDTSDERYANAVDAYRRKVAVAKGV